MPNIAAVTTTYPVALALRCEAVSAREVELTGIEALPDRLEDRAAAVGGMLALTPTALVAVDATGDGGRLGQALTALGHRVEQVHVCDGPQPTEQRTADGLWQVSAGVLKRWADHDAESGCLGWELTAPGVANRLPSWEDFTDGAQEPLDAGAWLGLGLLSWAMRRFG